MLSRHSWFRIPDKLHASPYKDRLVGIAMIAPVIMVMLGIVLYPLLYSIWLSFTDAGLLRSTSTFIGFDNYKYLLWSPEFWHSFMNGVLFASITVISQTFIGLVLALLLNTNFTGRNIARGVLLFPYVIPTVVATAVWVWMLNDVYGIINYVLFKMQVISGPISWLGSPTLAMISVILINIWEFFPFALICLLAGLQVIPLELYESARVDGASRWQQFIHITLPLLRDVLLIVVLLRGFWMFNKFDSVWLVTQGGPLGATQHLPILAYLKTFESRNIGLGAAISSTMFGMLIVWSVMYLKVLKPFDERG